MARTLLQLISDASSRMGLSAPSSVIGSGINQTIQLLALTQNLGEDLVREFEWQQMVRTFNFQTAAGITATATVIGTDFPSIQTTLADLSIDATALLKIGDVISGEGIAALAQIVNIPQPGAVTMSLPSTTGSGLNVPNVPVTFARSDYDLPPDYDRMVSDTNWDRTNHWRNIGSKSSQAWQTLQAGLISVGPRERYRIFNGKLRFFPAVATSYNQSFEYVSNAWILGAGPSSFGGLPNTKSMFTADTDTCLYPDDLMLAGLKYYFLKAKKLDFGIEMAEYAEILSTRKGQDVPLQTLSLAPIDIPMLVGPWSVQDGNWPTE